jgi:hypothetical protein
VTPSAERLKAGRAAKLVSNFTEEHPWEAPTRSSLEVCRKAAVYCAQRVVDGRLPRDQLLDMLGMLGLR